MKKLGLCLLPLLLLGGCDSKSSQNKNTSVVEQSKYTNIYTYLNVNYAFDSQMRCNVEWHSYNDNGSIKETKTWCVYLTGFYFEDRDYNYNYFYVCETKTRTYDYYLYVIG